MLSVKIIAHTNIDPIDLSSHAAKTCYMAKEPEMGSQLDVENTLFKVGHHTTLQHFYITFAINNIAIGDIKLGLHLDSPFYNSDERSGRYCAEIFAHPNYEQLTRYI